MSHKHRVIVALSLTAALAACAPPTSWARRVRKATASKRVAARPKPARLTPKKYLQMRVLSQQVYSNPVAHSMFGSAQAKEAGEAAKEKRGELFVDFQAPLVRLSADRYYVERSQVYLFGHAAIACEIDGKPLSISGEQLQLAWAGEMLPSDTVIEAHLDAGNISGANEAGDPSLVQAPLEAKPLSFSETSLPPAAKPLALLLRALQDEANNHGRFSSGGYVDGAPFSVARYVVKFQGASYSSDSGGYSEDGQIIYDQRKQVLFMETRTRNGYQNKSTLVQLRLADVTMARMGTVLLEGNGSISFTKPTLGDALAKAGAKVIKRSLTSSTYK